MFKIWRQLKRSPSYLYRNVILPRLLTRQYKNILQKNLAVKNIYAGQRCFILGSGPSIKDLDLNEFRNEHVLVVNEFDRHPQFKNLRRVCHAIPDTYYFTEDKNTYYWERLKNKSDNAGADTIFFFHLISKELIEKEGLFPKNKVYYISTQGIISEHFDFNIDLDKTLPWPKNSLLSCLMIAVYMGFREIYLLGCEHSFLAARIGPEHGQSKTFDHFYVNPELEQISKMNKEEAEKKMRERYRWSSEDVNSSYENTMQHILQLFKNYRLFYKKVRQAYPGIKIFNATPHSLLDVFPFIKYEEIAKTHGS